MHRRKLIKSMAVGVFSPAFFWQTGPFKLHSGNAAAVEEEVQEQLNEMLWFKYPARYWNSQALHIGNGFLGLSFLGGVAEEVIAVTEKSLWTGGPGEYEGYRYGIQPGGKEHLARIRQLILTGDVASLKAADELVKQHFLGNGSGYGHFSAFGRLSIQFQHPAGEYRNYRRQLNLAEAIARVRYEVGEVTFTREYFCSYPNRVAVLQFCASKGGSLSFRLKWQVFQEKYQLRFANGVFELCGSINGNNRQFCLKLHIACSSGRVHLEGEELVVENADTVTLRMAGATEYLPVPPLYKGGDPYHVTAAQVQAAAVQTVDQLKAMHLADYRALYQRVRLNIPGGNAAARLATNERWKNYATHAGADPGLKVLYFNLGRYLLISCSRPGSLPANLQGGWNTTEAAQWSGNYQSNINVQLNYSSACATNLAECLQPYIDWIRDLAQPGAAVAAEYYGSEGWVSHSIGNIWGYAAPGFEMTWGMYPAAAAWHCHFIWKQFLYSQNKTYLRDTGYPLLKGAALFWLQNLVKYKGRLISAPSVSAEHGVFVAEGRLLATGSSFDEEIGNVPCNFQDIEMIYELFTHTIRAAAVLHTDAAFSKRLQQARQQLMPLKTGRLGQLQEWEVDADTPDCNHRHIGHLYALWPARQINVHTPALAAAARQTLRLRGEERNYRNLPHKDIYTAGNWSLALRAACRLRLRDAEQANHLVTQIITEAGFENLMTYQQVTQPEKDVQRQHDVEFFKTPEGYWYPVWQIDTSLALPGLITEMLLQCTDNGTLVLLPALPAEWPEGTVQGLRAEGNFTVDLAWKNGQVTRYRIRSAVSTKVKVEVQGRIQEITTQATDQ